jgi:hypothetical protein
MPASTTAPAPGSLHTLERLLLLYMLKRRGLLLSADAAAD